VAVKARGHAPRHDSPARLRGYFFDPSYQIFALAATVRVSNTFTKDPM